MITVAVISGLAGLFCLVLIGPRSTLTCVAVLITALSMRFLP
jgi:hypothetical protein